MKFYYKSDKKFFVTKNSVVNMLQLADISRHAMFQKPLGPKCRKLFLFNQRKRKIQELYLAASFQAPSPLGIRQEPSQQYKPET